VKKKAERGYSTRGSGKEGKRRVTAIAGEDGPSFCNNRQEREKKIRIGKKTPRQKKARQGGDHRVLPKKLKLKHRRPEEGMGKENLEGPIKCSIERPKTVLPYDRTL